MGAAKKSTLYLEPELHRAIKKRLAETDGSMSELINEAVRALLAEELEDIEDIKKRKNEPSDDFESFLRKLKKDGKI